MSKEEAIKAIKDLRLTKKDRIETGRAYAYAYTDAINDAIEAVVNLKKIDPKKYRR